MLEFGIDSLFTYALIIGAIVVIYYFYTSKKNAK